MRCRQMHLTDPNHTTTNDPSLLQLPRPLCVNQNNAQHIWKPICTILLSLSATRLIINSLYYFLLKSIFHLQPLNGCPPMTHIAEQEADIIYCYGILIEKKGSILFHD